MFACSHRSLCRALAAALVFAFSPAALAEMAEIKVAQQYGISYLPLMIMEERKLIEKQAKANGVDVTVGWAKFAGGNVMNDALLSSSLQVASGGVGPLVTLWSRTRGNLDVRAIAAFSVRELLGFSAALLAAPIFQISGTGTSNVSGLTDANRREAVGLAPSASRLAMFFTACNGEPVQHLVIFALTRATPPFEAPPTSASSLFGRPGRSTPIL